MQALLRTDRVDAKSKFGVACLFGALSGQPGVPRSPTLRHRHGIFTCEVGQTAVFTALSGSNASHCFHVEVDIQEIAGTSRNVPCRDGELCFIFFVGISNQHYSSEKGQIHHPNNSCLELLTCIIKLVYRARRHHCRL
jgi:hypothetical protein